MILDDYPYLDPMAIAILIAMAEQDRHGHGFQAIGWECYEIPAAAKHFIAAVRHESSERQRTLARHMALWATHGSRRGALWRLRRDCSLVRHGIARVYDPEVRELPLPPPDDRSRESAISGIMPPSSVYKEGTIVEMKPSYWVRPYGPYDEADMWKPARWSVREVPHVQLVIPDDELRKMI